MSAAAQYMKSTDAEVLAVIAANRDMRQEFGRECSEWAAKHGVDNDRGVFFGGSFAGHYEISGIESKGEPEQGRWTQRRGIWRPFRNNPLHKEMVALCRQRQPIPGLPQVVYGLPNRDGTTPIYTPQPFIHDGAAYLNLGGTPDPARQEGAVGPQWVEIKGSEWHLAYEAVES